MKSLFPPCKILQMEYNEKKKKEKLPTGGSTSPQPNVGNSNEKQSINKRRHMICAE